MKRFVVSLISSILAFTAGLVTASSWTSNSMTETAAPVTLNVSPPCTPGEPQPPAPVQPPLDFGQNGLRLVPERVQLKSESQSYDIDVSYPQIVGTPQTGRNRIRIVNQQIKDAATKLYQWPLESGKMSDWETRSGARNTVNFTYHVGLATDSLLSISFIGYSYDGNNLRQLNDGFSANYDLTTGKQLKLSEIFKPGSNYLQVISRYCMDLLSKDGARKTVAGGLEPVAQNFQDWQITSRGITFNFNACKVVHCAEGDQTVHISFDSLSSLLNTGVPGKFNITYP